MERKDSIGRRKRTQRQPTGKSIQITPRDILWLEKLHQHGPLPTTYLHAYSKTLLGSKDQGRAVKRMADLFHESGLIERPHQQFNTINARYNSLVYDLSPQGMELLKSLGKYSDHSPTPNGPWVHKCMISCITSSIELETFYHDVRYIHQHEILERKNVNLRIPISYSDPCTLKTIRTDLIPDGLFGLEYQLNNGSSYLFFVLEADRSTEPIRYKNQSRKSFQRSLQQYREFIGRGKYKDHFGLTAGMLVLNITTAESRIENMMNSISESSNLNRYMLFQSVNNFGQIFKPVAPNQKFLTESWMRAGCSSYNLLHKQ